MGYCTSYELKWEARPQFKGSPHCTHVAPKDARFCPECGVGIGVKGLDHVVAEYISANQEAMYGVNEDGSSSESCKWYEHDKQMRDMSNLIRNVLFTLHGEGEEAGDIWNKYYLNGKEQVSRAIITFDPFDEKKLK